MNLGDDADTTGAIYGQLAGAYYGINAIPQDWIERSFPGPVMLIGSYRSSPCLAPRKLAAARRAVQKEKDQYPLFPELLKHQTAEERLASIANEQRCG